MKKFLLVIGILLTPALCHAQSTQSYNGWCQQGNQPVVLQGLNGTTACVLGSAIGVIVDNSGTINQMSGATTAGIAMSTTLALVQLHISQ